MQFTKTLCVVLCLAAVALTSVHSQENAANNRNNLLLRRGNIGRQNPLTKTTTTTPPPEYAEDEYVDEEGEQPEGEEAEEAPTAGRGPLVTTTTTTTEAPRKNLRPSIRPFRSNDDLLSALKKRRLESKNKPAPPKEKVYDDEDIPAPAPAKSFAKAPAIVPKGRRFGPARKEPEQNAAPSEQSEQSNASESANSGVKSLTSRLGRSRFALKQ